MDNNSTNKHDPVDHSSRSLELQSVFRKLDNWLGRYDLRREYGKNSHAFYLPGEVTAPNPLTTIQYMPDKRSTYVEFRYYESILRDRGCYDEFLTLWERFQSKAEAPDFTLERSKMGEYKLAFSGEASKEAAWVIKMLTPFMETLTKLNS